MKPKLAPTPCDAAAQENGPDQITKLTKELIDAKTEIERLQRACGALETTVRIQSRLVAALPL
jgi:hypothetical protein